MFAGVGSDEPVRIVVIFSGQVREETEALALDLERQIIDDRLPE